MAFKKSKFNKRSKRKSMKKAMKAKPKTAL